MTDLTTLSAVKTWLQIPNGEILSITPTAEGNGYHTAQTTISLSNVLGQGSGFAADPIIVSTKFKGGVIRNPGSLYLKGTPPTVAITDSNGSPGSGAGASLTIAEIQSQFDVLLSRLISAASSYFYQKTSRNVIASTGMSEVRNGHAGQTYLGLLEGPVTAVSSVSLDGTAIAAASGPRGFGYGFDSQGIYLRGTSFPPGYGNVSVSYTAGYAAGSPEMFAIEQCVIQIVGTQFERRKHIDETSRSIVGGAGQTVAFSQKDIPPEAQVIIDRFSRPMIAGFA